MKLVSLICLAVLCLITSVLYAIFADKKGWQGFFIRGLAMFSISALSLVSVYFKGLTNAAGIFLSLAFVAFLFCEGASLIDDENKKWIATACSTVATGILLAGVIALNQFSILPLGGGLLFGIGLALVVWAFNNEKGALNNIFAIVQLALAGGIVGVAAISTISSLHFTTTLLVTVGAGLNLIGLFIKNLNLNSKAANIIANLMITVGLAVIASSTYFY